jgi:hypothetical protein
LSNRWWILLTCTALSACTAVPRPAADKADVIVYRTAVPVGPDATVFIYDGDRLLGTLARGHYLHLELSPGPRVLKALAPAAGDIPYATTLTAGQTYYLMTYYRGLGSVGDFGLEPQDPASASSALKLLKETPTIGGQ